MRIQKAVLVGMIVAFMISGCGLFDGYADRAAEQIVDSTNESTVESSMNDIKEEVKDSSKKEDPNPNLNETSEKSTELVASVGETDLRAILEQSTEETILYFICDDFDDDGILEAFAATSENAADAEELLSGILDCISPYKIWFVTSKGAESMDESLFQDCFIYLEEQTFKGGKKVIAINNFFSAHDTRTYFVTVEDGQYVNLNVGDEYYYSTYFDENGVLHSMHYGFGDETVEVQEYLYYNGKIILADEYDEEW
jgi:hypothetical protein